MATMTLEDVLRFELAAAYEIVTCIEECELSRETSVEDLMLFLPMPFARSMALCRDPAAFEMARSIERPDKSVTNLRTAVAAACRSAANSDAAEAYGLPVQLGKRAADAMRQVTTGGTHDLGAAVFDAYFRVLVPSADGPVVRGLWERARTAWASS